MEKNSAQLVEVEDDFFSSLEEFLLSEKESYLKSLKDPSSSKARDFSNLHKLVVELFEIREKKLLNKALVALHTGQGHKARPVQPVSGCSWTAHNWACGGSIFRELLDHC